MHDQHTGDADVRHDADARRDPDATHDSRATLTLKTMPFLEDVEHGIFATRTPVRPNPLGLSVVRLIEKRSNILLIEDIDVLDGTPLLDIKPYVERFDVRTGTRGGWTDGVDAETFDRRGSRRGWPLQAERRRKGRGRGE